MSTITIHAEVEDGEGQKVYEGTSVNEGKEFLANLEKVTVLQVNMLNMVGGQKHVLARSAKSEAVESLLSDAVSWLEENGATKEEEDDRETVTITPKDVGKLVL
jgi:hypothetical protein